MRNKKQNPFITAMVISIAIILLVLLIAGCSHEPPSTLTQLIGAVMPVL